MIKEKIGDRVKELRILKLYLNQEEFATILGWDKAYLSRVESGKQNITIDNLVIICSSLGITLKDFFEPFNTIINIQGESNNESK